MTGIEYGPDLDEPYAEIGDEVHNLFDLKNYPIKRNSHRERAKIQRRMRSRPLKNNPIPSVSIPIPAKETEDKYPLDGEIFLEPIIDEEGVLYIGESNQLVAAIKRSNEQVLDIIQSAGEAVLYSTHEEIYN